MESDERSRDGWSFLSKVGGLFFIAATVFCRTYTAASYVLAGLGFALVSPDIVRDLLRRTRRKPAKPRPRAQDRRLAAVPDPDVIRVPVVRTIGVVATALPPVLLIGLLLTGTSIPSSISGTYYTSMRNVFVVSLCAVGLLLLAYRGAGLVDRWLSSVAGLSFFGVVLFPTSAPRSLRISAVSAPQPAGITLAHLLFVTAALIVLWIQAWRFARLPGQDRWRAIYYLCLAALTGSGLFALLLAVFPVLGRSSTPFFWPEGVALMAFGTSWLAKSLAVVEEANPASSASAVTSSTGPLLGDPD